MRESTREGGSGSGRWTEVPTPTPHVMLRPAVMAHLSDPSVRIIVVTAPAEYGKSSHVATAVRADHHQTAWIDIEPSHDDARTLLQEIVAALHVVGGLDPTRAPTPLGGPDPKFTGVASALGRAVRGCTERFMLVLDDDHLLTSTAALEAEVGS